MSNQTRMVRVLFAGALIMVFGACGSAKVKVKTTDEPTSAPIKPFAAPEMGEGGGGSATSTVNLTAEDQEIVVPGSQFGGAPPVAQPGAKKKKKGPAEPVIPYTDAVAEQMEGLEWGMTWKKVISLFEEKVREKFAKELSATAGDALAEDQVRTKMIREMRKLKDSFIEFKGQRTGYEAGMITDEFTHNNGESMLQWDAGKYVEYLFFFNGRFWKRLRAFRKDSFSTDITFMTFLGTLEGRFGTGLETFDDAGDLDKVAWRDETTFVAAIDRSKFYGAFGLRFTAAVTETYIDRLRSNKGRATGAVGDDVSKLVDQVTSGKENAGATGASVIDAYTGGAPAEEPAPEAAKGGKKKGETKQEPAAAAPAKKEEPKKDLIEDLF
ncbi:MAG TPA: hypothetical protein VM285_04725 [Polyangia bacterium]|nr:hypothetical protein [Polyangia bacterium]